MRRKFLLKVMILSLLFVAMGGGYLYSQDGGVTPVTSETELANALASGGNFKLGNDIVVTNTIEIPPKKKVTLDLNGKSITADGKIYPINNDGELTIYDSDEGGTGTIEGLGLSTGKTNSNNRSASSRLTINGGIFRNVYPDEGAALYVHMGIVEISGGKFYGQNVAISNTGGFINASNCFIDGYNYAVNATASTVISDAEISGKCIINDYIETTNVTFYQARIGEATNYTSYKTFAEALTAAGNMTGDVTVDILEKVTMKNNLSGNYSSIEFVGKDTDAEIYLDVQGYITATGKKVAFEDLTLSKSAGGFITNAGFMNVAFGVYDVTEVTYTRCNFVNGAYAGSGIVTYNDCTFKRSHDKYGLWAYGNVDVTVNGGKFDDYRGIKMYAEGAAKTVDLTVKNVDFSTVTDKPAIVLTYGESVNLENNTYSSTGVFELDKDGAPNGTEVTADIADLSCMNDIYSDCGVLVDGKIYTTIDDAKGVAKEGSVVTLFYEPETQVELPYGVELNTNNYGNVVVRDYYTYAEFNEYVRNGNCANLENKKVVLKDTERSYQNNQTAQFFVGATNINITDPVETVTLNKVTFEFLDDDNTNTYTSGELQVFAKNISFTECTFIGTAVSPWGVSNNENAETAAFIDCEWENLRGRYGVHQNRASNLTVTGCTFTDCERGIHTNSSTPLNIIITGNTFTGIGDAYGVLCIAENGNVGNAMLDITGNIATGQTFLRQLNENATYEQISAILNTDNNTYGTAYVVGSKVPVAKIGDKTYYKFEEAISSVGAGDVVIELLSDATLNYPARKEYGKNETTSLTINGNGNILTLHQTDTDWSSLGLVNEDAKFVFNNMTINKTKAGGNGAWNNHAINFYANVEMNGVIVNNSMQVTKGANLNNVTINEGGGYYGLWVSAQEQTVTMNGGAINATNGGRGIKIADEYVDAPAKVTLSVEGTTFNTAKKAAVLVTSTAGATITVSEVNIENVAEDNENFAWVDEDRAANFGEVTVNGNPAYIEGGIELYVAAIMKNDKEYGYYKKLQKAVDAVKDGETITLIADCAENVTLSEKTGLYYTIDGKNKTMTGKITVNPLSDTNDNRRITIKNINFKDETSDGVDFITAVNTNHYPRLTIEGCAFTGSGDDKDVAIRLKSSHSVIIKNCTGTKLHSFLQNTSGWNLTINKVTVTDSKGGLALGTVQGVSVKECNVTTDTYGIRIDANTYNNSAVIESCTVNAFIPVVVRNVNTESSITFNGTNTMTQTNTDGLWCAIGKTEYETNGVMPEAPETGYVSVTLNDENLDVNGIYNAISGNGSEGEPYYIKTVADLKFFRDQVNGGNNYAGKHVKLAANINLEGENWTPIGDITYEDENHTYKPVDASKVFSGVFDGNNKVIYNLKINKTVGGADTQANVGFFGMTGEGAVIKNLTLTNVNINTDGRNVGALIGYTYMATLDNITVNGNIQINGGNNVSGVAGMTRYYAMYATNIKVVGNDGSAIVGNNIVGGIFAEIAPNGSEHKFENLSVENVAITGVGGVGGVGGIVGLLTTGTVNTVSVKNVALTGRTDYLGNAMGRIRLGSVAGLMGGEYATIANATTENVTAENLDGNTVVLPIIGANYSGNIGNATEAKIGDTYYATLQIAIDAVKEGTTTINLLADIASDVTILQQEGKNIVIDGKKAENENYQFGGTIYVDGNNRHTGAETLTIQNVKFYTEKTTSHDFISANVANQYTHNVTVKGCNFATSVTNGNNEVVGLRLRQAYNIAVENCTSNYIFSLMWSTGVVGLDLNHVTVNNCTEGISIGGDSKSVTITDYNITSPSFGIRASVEGGQFTMTSSTINALVPVVVRNENVITDLAQYTLSFTFNGTNNITENNPTDYWFVAGETEYKGADDVMPTAPKGQVSVTLNDTGLRYEDVYGNYYELAGEGTADKPYTIANLYELKFFRDAVNAGNTYQGKYVKLTGYIDLNPTRTASNWDPIGTEYNPFKGTFDGAEKVVSNLNINHPGGEVVVDNVGFFGKTDGATIKNLTIDNASVTGSGRVAAVVGNFYRGTMTNVHLTGNIQIAAYQYVGGLIGWGYATVENCSVTGDGITTSCIKKVAKTEIYGSGTNGYVGGICGWIGEGNSVITESSVKDVTITTNDDTVGGICGIFHYGNSFTDCTLESMAITAPDNDGYNGIIAGDVRTYAGYVNTYSVKVTDVTAEAEGVELPALGKGSEYSEQSFVDGVYSGIVGNQNDAVAKIGDTKYYTIQAAVNAASEGSEIEVYANTTENVTIPEGAKLTIKFNENITLNGYILAPNADLTINDGTISNTNSAKSAVQINAGKLELNNVNITSARHAMRIEGTNGEVIATINGGTYKLHEVASQTQHVLNAGGDGSQVTVTINNGTFVGPKGTASDSGAAINVKNNASVTINGGDFSNGKNATLGVSGTMIVKGGTFDQDPTAYVAEGYTVQTNEEDKYEVFFPVAQIGTKYYADLHKAMVAAKSGETVKLVNDVDLAGTEWEPVIFNGIFDGQDHTISNLTINKPGVSNTGFITSLNGTFKNVTFTNPTVTGGENTAVVAGRAGGGAALAENITINGTIKVETTHSGYARAGGIVGGWGYGNYKNITVDGGNKATSYIKHNGGGDGRYVAGIVGHADVVESYTNCIVKNITISGGWLCGGIAGPGPSDGLASGCSVENIDMGADNSGGMFGWYYGGGTIENSIVKDVTFTDGSTNNGAIGGYSNNEDATVKNVTIDNVKNENGEPIFTLAATIKEGDDTYCYATLEAAFTAATEGQTITLLADATPALTSQKAITNAAVIDLDGKTLTLTEDDLYFGTTIFQNGNIVVDPSVNASTAVFWMFANQTLTFDDVELTATGVTGTYLIGINGGTGSNVNLLNGTKIIIDNESQAALSAVICDNGTGNNVKIENSDIDVKNIGGRFYLGGTSGNITVDNTDIDLNGVKEGFYLRANQTLSIEGNTTIDVVLNETTEERYGINFTDVNYTYTVEETATVNATVYEPVAIAQIGTTKYPTLQGAIAAVQNDETITLINNCELSESIKVNNNITLDLNGKTITGTDNATASFALIEIQPGKELTVTDGTVEKNGKITLTATNDRDWNAYSSVISNQRGKLTVNGGTIEHLGGTDMAYGIDNLTNGKGTYAETIITGGTVKSTYRAIRQFLNGTEAQNILTVNGGIIEGANKSIWMQDPSKNANTGTLTVDEDATLKGDVYLFVTDGSTSWPVEVSIAAAALAEGSEVISANVPAGYEVKEMNGLYGVYHGVAKIGYVLYESLAEAATAAQNGETIELLWQEGQAPIAMNASLYGKNVTITGDATVDWSKGWLFVGRGGAGDATLTFDNANLTSASDNASTGIHVSGSKKDNADNTYYGTVVINNSTIVLDYLINKGTMTLDNSTLTVKNGFSVGGRPASKTGSGEDATATMTLNNGSKVVVNNHNGMGLGYEAIGVMYINSGSTFETTQDFLITAKGTMNVDETSKIVNTNNSWINNKGVIQFNGSTLKDNYIDSEGVTEFAGTINFEGNNSVITTNIDGSPFELIVNEDATLLISRFVLGYDRAITVYGNIEDAHNLTAEQIASMTPSLKFNNPSGVSVGGTDTGRLTAKDAYLEFGNSSWKNSYAEHTWSFENCYVSATSFGNNNEPGAVTSTWDVTFDNSVLAAKNYIKNGVGVTYNFTNGSVATTGSLRIDGTLNVDANSSVTTTAQQNNVQNVVDEHGGINGTINIAGTLTIGSNAPTQLEVLYGEVNVNGGTINLGNNTLTLNEYSKLSSYGNIYGAITAAAGATIILTGGTYTQDVNEWCHADYDAEYNGNNTWTVIQVAGTQTRELATSGWYWFSTYIDLEGSAGLEKLQNAFNVEDQNGNIVCVGNSIKSRTQFSQYYDGYGWDGNLQAITTAQMYMINTDSVTLELTGDFVEAGRQIPLVYGWNSIGYPVRNTMSINDAFENIFVPTEGDVFKSKNKTSFYEDGEWFPEITLEPGHGYMYQSKSSESKTLVYKSNNNRNTENKTNIDEVDYHWLVDATQYPGNMTIVAMLSIDNEIVKYNYEIAAFANGECRGSARPMYNDRLGAYILILTIHGEEVEELTFKYYDVNYGTEYELSNRINYSDNAIVGSFEEPYMFNLGILNIDETSVDQISIYPNPTTTGKEINLQAMCDKVEVFNALGVKVAEYSNVDSIDALETAGIYVIRVTIDGNARNCRLVVR